MLKAETLALMMLAALVADRAADLAAIDAEYEVYDDDSEPPTARDEEEALTSVDLATLILDEPCPATERCPVSPMVRERPIHVSEVGQ